MKKMCTVNKIIFFIIEFNLVHEKKLDYKVKQLKTNLQKYVHPSSLNQLIDAQVRCQETKKVRKRFQF